MKTNQGKLSKWDKFLAFCEWRRNKLHSPELTEIQIENTFEKFEHYENH